MKLKVFNKYTMTAIGIGAGLLLGWLLFHTSNPSHQTESTEVSAKKENIWTCSMHPQIRKTEPGKCPICAMDLISLNQSGAVADPIAIHLTPEAIALANVETSVVSSSRVSKEIRLFGKVQLDERLIQSQVSHISGRIEKLAVNFTGEPIRKGQELAVIYSPDLVNAQQELLESSKNKESQPEIYAAARQKLSLWKLTEEQINDIEKSGNIQVNQPVLSNTSGIITSRSVSQGDYVTQGSKLFEVSDISRLWVLFEAYETDLPFLRKGNSIEFTFQALPGKNFEGKVSFIDPIIDPATRISRLRVEVVNRGQELKPGMFATGIVKSEFQGSSDQLLVPRSAVLWTGKRSIVYVKLGDQEGSTFKIREIELGPLAGDFYLVNDGLMAGEEIVTNGVFSVDAAAQLEGKPSMMNQTEETMPMGHDHGQTITGNPPVKEIDFKVSGNCEMCKDRIETAAKSVQGISAATWDMTLKKIHLTYDPANTDLNSVHAAIAKVGHDTERVRAADSVYNSLPECCLYR